MVVAAGTRGAETGAEDKVGGGRDSEREGREAGISTGATRAGVLVENPDLVLNAPGDEEGADKASGEEAKVDPEGDVGGLAGD